MIANDFPQANFKYVIVKSLQVFSINLHDLDVSKLLRIKLNILKDIKNVVKINVYLCKQFSFDLIFYLIVYYLGKH